MFASARILNAAMVFLIGLALCISLISSESAFKAPELSDRFSVVKRDPVTNITRLVFQERASGFFSACSVRLDQLCAFFNKFGTVPDTLDQSRLFTFFKPPHENGKDITSSYFMPERHDVAVNKAKNIPFSVHSQYMDYSKLPLDLISPMLDRYFTPSNGIVEMVNHMESKYNVTEHSYENICVLFFRGNDKKTEAALSSYEEIIAKAKILHKANQKIVFIIQSDETPFLRRLAKEFPDNHIIFQDEIRSIDTDYKKTVDLYGGKRSENHLFSKYFLSIVIIMSKCKYIVFGSSSNGSLWITLFRGHTKRIVQFLHGKWIDHDNILQQKQNFFLSWFYGQS